MRYAQLQDGKIVGFIPTPTRPMFHDRWYDCRDEAIRAEYLAAAGYVPVITTPQPEDTETETTGLSYTVGVDSVTQVWTPRPWTAEELAVRTASTNRVTITDKARQALTANAGFLALTSPTNAQVLTQVKVLTRECSALIRLMLDELSTTDGT